MEKVMELLMADNDYNLYEKTVKQGLDLLLP
jgi:hypothetical protein